MARADVFEGEYKKLNKAQKEAVDTIDGPVMVVAGPGTGKTQILALRIGNMLLKTDTKADSVLCLTFTNAGVEAMKERLCRYIGDTGKEVNIFTFHSFGMKIIEEYFMVLGLKEAPKILEDTDRAIFFDQILNENDWKYLRPRGNSMRYFQDLKSLISLLKRERISKKDFAKAIEKEIEFLRNDNESISKRGETKGELKKEVLKNIEGLEHSGEIVKFIELYEKAKKEKNLLDYDDVLEYLVKIVEISEDAASDIRERYLYILIDEHQDSSRVQNEFLQKVWGSVEKPNIFVVGDDRQLIYGFSGASIDHFKGFQKSFHHAKIIPLVDNYRSTQIILDASHALLKSVMSGQKLVSQNKEAHPISLIEADTPDAEIIAASIDIKSRLQGVVGPLRSGEKIKKGVNPNDCAILVPKNKQVRSALLILHERGLPLQTSEALSLFDQDETHALLRVLKIINDGDAVSLAMSFFDKSSGIGIFEAHKFIAEEYMRDFSFHKLLNKPATLFLGSSVDQWIKKLSRWNKDAETSDLKSLIQIVGKELLPDSGETKLVSGKEILDTILGLLQKEQDKNPDITLGGFVSYLERLGSYDEHIPLVAAPREGIKVLTMHGSKGLEFDYVWIAHMDENSLTGGRKMGFTLPPSIAEKIEERDIDAIKRKLYVAITRAKRFCTLSYSLESHKGMEQELAKVIADLPKEVFKREVFKKQKTKAKKTISQNTDLSELVKLAADKYKDRYVSVSLLNNFFECPWKWYFRNLLQLPEEKTESLEFGIKVHVAIDKILKLNKIVLPDDKEVAKVVSAWAERRLKDIDPNRENEQSISLNDSQFPHLKIYGKIDLIENLPARHADASHVGGGDKEAREVRVTDFKTGSVRKKSEIEKIDEEGRISGSLRQLAMYSYLLEQSVRKLKVSESRLEFLEAKNPKESFYDRVISKKEIGLLIKDISDYDELVKKGKWVKRPCHYNSYGKNTECEYCKIAQIYK